MLSVLIFGMFQHEIGQSQLVKLVNAAKEEAGSGCVAACSAGSLFVSAPRLEQQIDLLFESGIDLVFSGEQSIARNAGRQILNNCHHKILRPQNLPDGAPGVGQLLMQTGSLPLWVLSLSDGSGKVLCDPAHEFLFRFFGNKKDNFPVFIDVGGTDFDYRKSLFLKFSRSSEATMWCGCGTGYRVGEIDADANGNIFIADTGVVAAIDSIGGQAPEVWWKRNIEKIPVSSIPGWGQVRFDYSIIRLDKAGRIVDSVIRSQKI